MNGIKPNLILKNGSVYTVDQDRSWAQAVAIAGGPTPISLKMKPKFQIRFDSS